MAIMKKFFVVFYVFIFNLNYGYANIVENIDKERQNCFEINFQSDYTMAQCNYAAIEKYNSEIQKSLKNLKKTLTKSQYKLLLISQKHWNTFIKNDNTLLANTLENKFYFEPYLISSNIKFENYKQRCQELNDFYEYLKILK